MPHRIVRQARKLGASIYRLTTRSEPLPPPVLSTGALASIAIAGAVFFFLIIVGPILIKIAKRRRRQRAAEEGSVTSLSSAEHGQLSLDEHFKPPRRLRKRSVVSDGVMYGMKQAEYGGEDGKGKAKHLSLPILPPAFSRPESFGVGVPLVAGFRGDRRSGNGSANRTRPGLASSTESPEKRRGHAIYQNRRKTSWIDEDALHGPRVSTKDAKKRSSWLAGSGLTRTLSRHLSISRFYAPELSRSPTLPYLESGEGPGFANGTPRGSLEGRVSGFTENPRISRESRTENEIRRSSDMNPPHQQSGSINYSRPAQAHPGPQRASAPGAVPPSLQGHSDTAIDAAQQLAGQARVPGFDIRVNEDRYSRLRQSSTDAELQAILNRTAERLQDGNRSARRQTLMLPASSPAKAPQQGRGAPSPTKSQKSAPAIMLYSEPQRGGSIVQQGPSQHSAPWRTHKRTRTQELSHILQSSQVSVLSGPTGLMATPSRHGPQVDMVHTALSSPSRSLQASPSHSQKILIPRPYSPASDQSSALSTVYSEEEGSSSTSVLKLENDLEEGKEMEREAMAEVLRASATFGAGTGEDDNSGADERQEQENTLTIHGPRPLYGRGENLEHSLANNTQTTASSASEPQDGIKQPPVTFSSRPISTIPNLQLRTDDPFTTHATPERLSPQRLSKVFSPLPADPRPQDATDDTSAEAAESLSGTPTPSPSRRRVIPPAHSLRPRSNSPTLGHYHDPQFHIQPPSRGASPVESEGGLSSVYDSYRYSRYSDNLDAPQMLALSRASTMLAAPPSEASPTKRWDPKPVPGPSTESHGRERGTDNGGAALRPAHLRLNSVLSGAGRYSQFIGGPGSYALDHDPARPGYTTEGALPRSQRRRDVSVGTASCMSGESVYSQDEDGGDKLAPLMPIYPSTGPGKHTSRVLNAVAELRRMNSQVSCVSAYSTATTNVTSPTLPALRGGGCSPGKKGAVGASKNYFSLGGSQTSGGDEGEYSYGGNGRRLDDGSEQDGKMTVQVEMNKDMKYEFPLPRGGVRRSRRNTVVESYEQDLDRARQVHRGSRAYNLQSMHEVLNNAGSGGPTTQVAR